jgi:hypothetical protein
LVLAAALAVPAVAAANAAMEPQATVRSPEATQPAQPAAGKTHRPLFVVKFVLRRAPPEPAPQIEMNDSRSQLALPVAGGYRGIPLGAVHRDPNTVICYGRGCERLP